MKKILSILGIAASIAAYAQGTLIINNYTIYDYRGDVIAHNMFAPCYPRVVNNVPIIVPANSNTGTGTQLQYDNFRDQYTSSLYPMAEWSVGTSPNSTNVRPWDHFSLAPGGTFSNNTRWGITKFGMVYAGTNNNVVGFSADIAIAGNPCYTYPDYFTTPNGLNSGEMFIITSGSNVTTYIQLY
ncbi:MULTISPECIES: hypothetical protein [unclassified Chryseobacterium]|uniref:hypothetical protein n=1 Tax=unclassified Chryseobacterium TaxID=2593645 RepID=UPI00300FDB01